MIAIAAHSLNRVIGHKGTIPWKCPADMKWFKETTIGHTLVMGKTTFETMPFLKDRNIIVLTHSSATSSCIGRYEPGTLRFVNDIDILPKDCIVVGGAKVYAQLLPFCDELYITHILKEVEGDTFMPAYGHLFMKSVPVKADDEMIIMKYSK